MLFDASRKYSSPSMYETGENIAIICKLHVAQPEKQLLRIVGSTCHSATIDMHVYTVLEFIPLYSLEKQFYFLPGRNISNRMKETKKIMLFL